MAEETTILKGEVLRFRFRGESGDFAVALVRTEGGSEEIVVCGSLTGAEPGRLV